jgi:lipopolysaccharide export LptBFGC system permease protein LptF
MSWTLQWYIFRDVLKTFGLSTVALLLLFTSGMGLLRAFNVQDITPADLLRLFLFLVPLSASLLLPVSALFSAAVTYGRFAADNELDACKASGINVHWLLLPAGVLAGLVAVCGFAFGNYLVPHLSGQLDKMIEPTLPQIFARELARKGHIALEGRYALYADQVEQATVQQNNPQGVPTKHHYVVLNRVAFVVFDQDGPSRFGTAASTTVEFRMVGGTPVVEAGLHDLRAFDCRRNQSYEVGYEPVRPMSIPLDIKQKPKWWNLDELLYYRRHPVEAPNIRTKVEQLRLQVAAGIFYRSVIEAMQGAPGRFELSGPDCTYQLQASEVRVNKEDGSPLLMQPRIVEVGPAKVRRLQAERAGIRVERIFDRFAVKLSLHGDVRIADPQAIGGLIKKASEDLPLVPLPQTAIEAANRYSSQEIIDPEQPMPLVGRPQEGREELRQEVARLGYKIGAIIHHRLAYAACPLVLVVLGAGLGVIVRGGQILTAFGVSFLPALFVIVTIIMGYQLAQNANTAAVGVGIIWGGLGVVGVLNPLIIWRYMRR